MKKITHAWLAFRAIERLNTAHLAEETRTYAQDLQRWFGNHKDHVIQGAWYPDEIIKDNSTSHVLKFTPAGDGPPGFRRLTSSHRMYANRDRSPVFTRAFEVDPNDNLPNRCEAIAHSVIDNLKIQEKEEKGSPVSATDNHVALLMFMLSHYIADAHMPFHCDSRRFSAGCDLHAHIESEWEHEIEDCFQIDQENDRFYYTPGGTPLPKAAYAESELLLGIDSALETRPFRITWGTGNRNVLEYMQAVAQHSYLFSYRLIPEGFDHTNVTLDNWQHLSNQQMDFQGWSTAILVDAVDSISRVWFRVWRRYVRWKKSAGIA